LGSPHPKGGKQYHPRQGTGAVFWWSAAKLLLNNLNSNVNMCHQGSVWRFILEYHMKSFAWGLWGVFSTDKHRGWLLVSWAIRDRSLGN
jgi:hypothetical protein